ncbi:MAG: TetR/AcrR family transcriptional regulator [Pseudomonadota bacterium]
MTDRKTEILQVALEIIATEGYGKLTLRALARASGLKLGALQYHFPTWDDLLVSLAKHIGGEYGRSLEELERTTNYQPTLLNLTQWYMTDSVGENLRSAKLLWPQLWAMSRVEPTLKDALDHIHRKTIALFESELARAGSPSPRLEAMALVSFGEGSLLISGPGGPFEGDAEALREALLQFIATRYGNTSEVAPGKRSRSARKSARS